MTHTISIEGMSCEGCESTVKDALLAVTGVTDAVVDREANTAMVDGTADATELVAAVTDAGYEATLDE